MAYLLKFVALAFITMLSCAAWPQDTEMARKKCVEFGFKDKTPSHDNCMKQFLQSTGAAKAPAKPATAASALSAAQLEEKFWDAAMAAGNKEAYTAYLENYPRGRYVGLARANVTRLEAVANAQQQALAEAAQKLAAERAAFEADQKLALERAEAAVAQKLANERAAAEAARKAAAERAAVEAARKMVTERAAGESAQKLGASKGATGTTLRYSPGQVIKDCAECPEMVVIPGGSFNMGSDESMSELPIHRVNVPDFLLGKTEVTQGQWKAVMGSNPSKFRECGDDCPVEQVSWNDSQEFVRRLSLKTGKVYRLPSEAEWEYAARAGSNTKWGFGDNENQLGEYAWYVGNSSAWLFGEKKSQRVAQKKPNGFGLYDMHGNVSERVEDCWHANYNIAPTDGIAWTTACSGIGRVVRGGSLYSDPSSLRSTARFPSAPDSRSAIDGFRLASTP